MYSYRKVPRSSLDHDLCPPEKRELKVAGRGSQVAKWPWTDPLFFSFSSFRHPKASPKKLVHPQTSFTYTMFTFGECREKRHKGASSCARPPPAQVQSRRKEQTKKSQGARALVSPLTPPPPSSSFLQTHASICAPTVFFTARALVFSTTTTPVAVFNGLIGPWRDSHRLVHSTLRMGSAPSSPDTSWSGVQRVRGGEGEGSWHLVVMHAVVGRLGGGGYVESQPTTRACERLESGETERTQREIRHVTGRDTTRNDSPSAPR